MGTSELRRGIRFFAGRAMCCIGLHNWVPQLWAIQDEALFFKRYGCLPTLHAYCWYCAKKREICR